MEKREGARNDSTRLVSMTHFSTKASQDPRARRDFEARDRRKHEEQERDERWVVVSWRLAERYYAVA